MNARKLYDEMPQINVSTSPPSFRAIRIVDMVTNHGGYENPPSTITVSTSPTGQSIHRVYGEESWGLCSCGMCEVLLLLEEERIGDEEVGKNGGYLKIC
nr:hypothetical protein [Tanacetum cinerariifolium]